MRQGTLTVNCGSMYSGKSSELLRQGERHILAGHKVIFIKPAIDTRYAKNEVVTHVGQSMEAIRVHGNDRIDILDTVLEADVVLLDEVQFFVSEYSIGRQVLNLIRAGKTVYASGLDMDFLGEPFTVTADLMARADVVNKFKAVCACCGADATFSGKNAIAPRMQRIQLGAKELYIPLCRDCFEKQKNEGAIC